MTSPIPETAQQRADETFREMERSVARYREENRKLKEERDEAQARLVGCNVAATGMRLLIHSLADALQQHGVEDVADLIEKARTYKP